MFCVWLWRERSTANRHTLVAAAKTASSTRPYAFWTRKVDNKTVTRMLNDEEVANYQPMFDNARKIRDLVGQLRDLSLDLAEPTVAEQPPQDLGAGRTLRGRELPGVLSKLVLDCSTDPARHGTVVLPGATANLFEGLGWESHWNQFAQLRPASARLPLGLLVLGLGIEVVFILSGHLLGGHLSSRYRVARWSAAS